MVARQGKGFVGVTLLTKKIFLDITTLPQNTFWHELTAKHDVAMMEKGILWYGLIQNVSDLIFTFYGINFDEPLSNMFPKILITYIDMFCK